MQRILFTLFLSLFFLPLVAQDNFSENGKGLIRGTVFDAESGESLIGVTILVEGTTMGTITDLDGQFSLEVPAGTHNIKISYISYATLTIEQVAVASDATVSLGELKMESNTTQLQAVVVQAEAARSTETALMSMKKKHVGMLDGVSSSKISLSGDGTAGEAAKRVTGVTIEGGKYVYVRGLGDRYTKTTLNNVDIPGLDPDRNSIQLDIFPSSLIDNITVQKNFTADMPAEFTGGMLNIETKAFPTEKFFEVSLSTGYNPSMHFNNGFLTYEGGSTDFLGFDDGTRALPARANSSNIPTPLGNYSPEEVSSFVQSFSPTLGATPTTSLMDYSVGFSLGNQLELRKKEKDGLSYSPKLGYIFSAVYSQDYKHYDNIIYGEYQRFIDPAKTEMRYATVQNGVQSEQSALLGILGGLAYKTLTAKIRLSAMHLQNGISRAGQFNIDNDGEAVGQSGYLAASDNLEYNQRGLTNVLLHGNHNPESSKWTIDWRLSATQSTSDDPDIRKTAFTFTPIDTFFSAGAGGNPSRIWRSLSELNLVAKVDLTRDYKLAGNNATLKIGAGHTYRTRDYEILFFDVQFFGNQNWVNPDPTVVLNSENIYPNQPNSIYYQSGNPSPNPNAYAANANNTAFYLSNEYNVTPKLRSILGLRAENFEARHTGRDQRYASGDTENGRNLVNEPVLSSLDLFPSAIFIYEVLKDQNLRASYTRTIARPSFKELSFAQILDPISNRIFNGSLFTYSDWDGQLIETRINNFDLRWERFSEGGQLVSASVFYKQFDSPIELVRIPEQQTSTEYQPRNVGNGQVFGVEFEVRKKLTFLSPKFRYLNLDVNTTFVYSEIDMTDLEFNARKTYEKEGETIEPVRAMAGQSPYVINAGINYNNYNKGLDVGLFYNVKGRTLTIVGAGLFPDIYTEPFHSLNFGFSKRFGEAQKTKLDIKVANLLGDKREVLYQSFEAAPQPFDVFDPGRTISVGISHKF